MKSTYKIASIFGVSIILWLGTGLLKPSANSTQGDDLLAAKVPYVKAIISTASEQTIQLTLRGRTQAKRVVTVKAETSGRVVKLPVEKGNFIDAGASICQLSEDDRGARVREAKAAVVKAQLDYAGAQKLARDGYQSETTIAGAKAKLETQRANLVRSELDLQRSNIRAPFAGYIESRPVELGAILDRGATCATLIDPDPMLLVGDVAEKDIQQVTLNSLAVGQLITGETVSGNISYISQLADENTRTYRVEIEVANPMHKLIAGLTTQVLLPVQKVNAHYVSSSLLTLDDNGDIGVRLLDSNNIAHFHKVILVKTETGANAGVWIGGLPDQITLITFGQELVSEGQVVEVDLQDSQTQLVTNPDNVTASKVTPSLVQTGADDA